jgi:hypothetical protein
MLNPARWLWFNPEEVVRIYSKHRFRPKRQIPNVGILVEQEKGLPIAVADLSNDPEYGMIRLIFQCANELSE